MIQVAEYDRIKCGNHMLVPEVTIEAARYTGNFSTGATTYTHKTPIVTIRCAKCGRTAQAVNYKVDYPVREHTFY